MWQKNPLSALVLDFTAYTTSSYVSKDSEAKELSQVTSVAKQTVPAAQSNDFEYADREIQLRAYKNEEVRHLAAAIDLA
jgi:hypothetical protein